MAERGLALDAFNCARSALETTAFYWLVCKDAGAAERYRADKSPQPVEIRKALEQRGIDVSMLRDNYALQSSIVHVGNSYDRLQVSWETDTAGKLLIGGGSSPATQDTLLGLVPGTIVNFLKHDQDYVITIADDDVQVRPVE